MINLIFLYLIIPIQLSVSLVQHSFMKYDPPGSWKCPLTDEVTCNDHIYKRKCICHKRTSDMSPALYPYCDNLIPLDRAFGHVVTLSLNLSKQIWFKCEYSEVIGAHYPYRSLDEALTTNIQMCGSFEENGVVILRKRCIKDKFQVQLAILKSPRKRLSNLTDNDFANFFKYHIARFMGRKYIATEFENADRLFPIMDNTPSEFAESPKGDPPSTPKPVTCFSFLQLNFYHCGNAHLILYCTLGTCIFALLCAMVYYDRMMTRYENKVIQVVRMNALESAAAGTNQQQTLL